VKKNLLKAFAANLQKLPVNGRVEFNKYYLANISENLTTEATKKAQSKMREYVSE